MKPTPHLPDRATEYGRDRRRRRADPIGLYDLPTTRRELNILLRHLCEILIAAGGRHVLGGRLVARLNIADTRTLRLLVAYGHVHHYLRAIVGTPGSGYCWGDLAGDGAYTTAALAARRMGECHFFLATLFGKAEPAAEVVQLMFAFAHNRAPSPDDGPLHALLAARNIGPEQLADAMIAYLRDAPGGGEILRRLGHRHQDVLLPAEAIRTIRENLSAAMNALPVAV